VTKVAAGNLVLVEGIDAIITKTATAVPEFMDEEVHAFRYALVVC
jgi:U5 small nuclear ribonucleoprotein component